MTLRAIESPRPAGALRPNDHRALRWVTADELEGLPWVPADRAWLGDLTRALHVLPRLGSSGSAIGCDVA